MIPGPIPGRFRVQNTHFCHETAEFLRILCQEAGWKHSVWLLSISPSLIHDFTHLFSPLLSCPASHLLLFGCGDQSALGPALLHGSCTARRGAAWLGGGAPSPRVWHNSGGKTPARCCCWDTGTRETRWALNESCSMYFIHIKEQPNTNAVQ